MEEPSRWEEIATMIAKEAVTQHKEACGKITELRRKNVVMAGAIVGLICAVLVLLIVR